MAYDINATEVFEKQLKKLAKKYKSLGADMQTFLAELAENPHSGKDLGNHTYKSL